MNWINILTPFALVAALLVFLQGVSILRGVGEMEALGPKNKQTEEEMKKERKKASGSKNIQTEEPAKEERKRKKIFRRVGWLTILLAILGAIINLLFLSSDIAISPEFGVFIIQGVLPAIFFAICLFGLVFCILLGWDLARLREDWELWGKWLYVIALLIGITSSLTLLTRIDPPGGNEVPVVLYDIWWPPLLLWMIVGFTDIVFTILRVRDRLIRSVTAAGMVLLMLILVIEQSPEPDFAHPWTREFWAAAAIILLIPMAIEITRPYRVMKENKQEPGNYAIISHCKHVTAKEIHKPDHRQWYTLGSLAMIVMGVITLLSSPSYIGPALGIIFILVGWGCMTEVITDGWFHHLYQGYKSGEWFDRDGSLGKSTAAVGTGIKKTGERLGMIFSLSSPWTGLMKIFLAVAGLIVLNEALNGGKTIIQPFQVIGFEDTAALVESADDRLINDLSVLNQQLQPIIIFPTSAGIRKKRIDYVQAGNVSTSIDASLNNIGELDIGTVKIPANVLVAPLQGVVRPWLKTRVVSGSIVSNGEEYVLLVNASDGNTWISQPVDARKFELYRAIPGLVEEIAFQMLSSEDTLQTYGLTKDWEAFQFFQAGVEHIRTFESYKNYDALADAIEDFRNATIQDPTFALAYYRLGLALQQNRQPWQAEEALRTGLSLNPGSIPLKNALAYHLYFFDSYTPYYPAVIPPPQSPTFEVKKYQARRLWHQIVNLPGSQVVSSDRASAYLGLCFSAMNDNNKNNDYLAYFYCFKSHTLLERLPKDQQSQDKIRQADASALNNLGVIIMNMGNSRSMETQKWFCLGRDFGVLNYHPPYIAAALKYYERALDLQPQESVIRCNEAIAGMLKDPKDKRMWELENNAQAHYVLGSKYLDQARREAKGATSPSPYYKKALQEFKQAIDLNPSLHEALNAFAHTYWVFRLRWPDESLDTLGIDHLSNLAESYADKALRLADMQQDSYLKVMYGSTKAEVLIAKGDFTGARDLLHSLNVPKSYVLDEVRWDYAQAILCLVEEGEQVADDEAMEREARIVLKNIREHEDMLETRIFSGNHISNSYYYLLTEYRLPCSQFSRSQE